jgi:hypothetical protein
MNPPWLLAVFCYLKQAFAPVFLSNWVLAALGITGAIVAICTLRTLVRQTNAAMIAANAAKTGADTSRMAERAYCN